MSEAVHPTDSWNPEKSRTVMCTWKSGTLEIYLLKFHPNAKFVASYLIIGRGDPDGKFDQFGTIQGDWFKILKTFNELPEKLLAAYPEQRT